MTQITFKTHLIPRADHALATTLDVRGEHADTLKAHALQAVLYSDLDVNQWRPFEVEGQVFVARFDSDGDIEVEKQPGMADAIDLLRQCLFLFNDMPRYRPRNGSQDTYAMATKIETVFRVLGVKS